MTAQRSRLTALAMLLAISTVLAACSNSSTPAPAQPSPSPGGIQNAVSISNLAFSPALITIPVGTKVTWTNNDPTTHTVTADDGKSFNSGDIAAGATYAFTFMTVGTFPYHCTIHGMKGKVVVIP